MKKTDEIVDIFLKIDKINSGLVKNYTKIDDSDILRHMTTIDKSIIFLENFGIKDQLEHNIDNTKKLLIKEIRKRKFKKLC